MGHLSSEISLFLVNEIIENCEVFSFTFIYRKTNRGDY